ncbi:unnamed protein product [Rotaria socialis]|uniref:Uncharacterized protein n=1 Tax=Rotaria socialis TaxID=392032 RepID=A0A821TDF1_9BILA|nr:unnamed protein product [Rotaria socialis]CAF4866410.1 unnamed protein product [Rotaria socialis]CAF4871206.1 unnamed protein product [Rotaria socialis]
MSLIIFAPKNGNRVNRDGLACGTWFKKPQLDKFCRLLLIRSITPAHFVKSVNDYIIDSLVPKYGEDVVLDMEKMWNESDKGSPMICFLSMGSDPTVQRLLALVYPNGIWGLSQNYRIHPDFSLWITTKVHPEFPIGLLQISINYTAKAP